MKTIYSILSALLLLNAPVISQTRTAQEAVLNVTVLDPSGAAIPNAEVKVVGTRISSRTSSAGRATFKGLKTRDIRIEVTAAGFETSSVGPITLKPGENERMVRLEIAAVEEEISVGRDRQESNIDPRGNAFSTVLTAEQIAQLPDDPDEFEEAIKQMAGPGAAFRVNGFRGGRLPPKNQIREIRFRTNAYAAESHESAFMSVDILTKPGIESWHGSINLGFRDESLNARNPFASYRAPEQNRRFAFDLGGPIWKNRTSLFVSADGQNSYEARTIVAALPAGNFLDQVRQPWRMLNATARIEHLLTPTHTSRFEYQRNATRRNNLGVGNFDLPDRGYTSDSEENLMRFADSGSIGRKLFNEFRFQLRRRNVGIDSLSDAPTILVLNSFNSGGAQIDSVRRTDDMEIADNLDFAFGKHAFRTGAMLEFSRYSSDELRNLNGTFIFPSLQDFNAGRPINFTRRSGAGSVDLDQAQFGWYLQDDWRAAKSLTLSLGVRHEAQSNLADRNNVAPRFGFAWSPLKSGNTTIRGGAGLFYDWFGAETLEQALRVNGLQQQDTVIINPGYPDPLSSGTSTKLPPSLIRIDDQLRMPVVYQASIGLQQQLPWNLRLMTQYSWRRGAHQLRGRNINAPLPDGARPDPLIGNVTQVESSANSFGHNLMVNLNWMRMGRFMISANYSYSRTTDETDGPLTLPANNFDLRPERGPSLQDIRHRFFLMSNFTMPFGFRLSSIFQANSASPYNITTGFDENLDSTVNDRPAGTSRNSARGAGRWDLNTRLSWGFGFGKPPDQQGSAGPQVRIIRGSDAGDLLGSVGSLPGAPTTRFRTDFYVQATNILNNVNPIGFSGVLTSPFFGRPIAALPARRIEVGTRFSF